MRKSVLLFAAAFCFAAFSAETPARPKSLKVLMIGNSFSICVQQEMPKIAKSMGLELDLASLYIGGCSFERHWQNVVAATNAAFRPYKYTRFVDGKKTLDEKANIPAALASEKWDVVTFQQASHFSWRGESYEPFASNLMKTIRELAPQAEIVVQETWSYTPWDKRLAKWGFDQNEMYSRLHRAYGDFAAGKGLRVIPMGTAVQLFRAQLPVAYAENSFGGDVCGSAKFVQADGKWTPKGDVFHLNSSGHYLQGLVWTAKLFGADVTQCAYAPKTMKPETAALMKKCAMEAVRGKLPPKANGGPDGPKSAAREIAPPDLEKRSGRFYGSGKAAKRPLVIGLADRCWGGPIVGRTNTFAVCAYNYSRSVGAAGDVPYVLPFTTNAAEVARLVSRLDVLVLCGGEDVAPVRYGEEPSPKCGAPNLRRDAFEFALLGEAVKRRLPVVGTCRGHQIINVYFGGTLVQDVPSEVPNAVKHGGGAYHPVSVVPGSRTCAMLGGATNAVVNSWHHQAVEKVAPGFKVTARAPDGVVEAIEHESLPIASVQFHPEVMYADDGVESALEFFARILDWAGAR